MLQYAERRVAELEMGCAGGIHYQGRQLHLEIVAAISTCRLSQCERDRSYSERPGYHPHVFLRSLLHTCEIPLKGSPLNNRAWQKQMSHLRITATFASCQPDEGVLPRESLTKMQWQLCRRLLFKAQQKHAAPHKGWEHLIQSLCEVLCDPTL